MDTTLPTPPDTTTSPKSNITPQPTTSDPLTTNPNDAPQPTAPSNANYSDAQLLHFVRGYGDFIISLGIVLIYTALSFMETHLLIKLVLFVAACEWLIKRRHLMLPSMTLFVLLMVEFFYILGLSFEGIEATLLFVLLAALSTGFYWRYRLPLAVLGIAISLVLCVLTAIGWAVVVKYPLLLAITGFLIFAVALWLDASDRLRFTARSDCAFWLHLLAAPLIVHSIMLCTLSSSDSYTGYLIILLLFVVFILAALLIDRRSLMLASLAYGAYALLRPVYEAIDDGGFDNFVFTTVLVTGLLAISFGVYWQAVRGFLFTGFFQSDSKWLSNAQQWVPPVVPTRHNLKQWLVSFNNSKNNNQNDINN